MWRAQRNWPNGHRTTRLRASWDAGWPNASKSSRIMTERSISFWATDFLLIGPIVREERPSLPEQWNILERCRRRQTLAFARCCTMEKFLSAAARAWERKASLARK